MLRLSLYGIAGAILASAAFLGSSRNALPASSVTPQDADVNKDGAVTIADAIAVLPHIGKLAPSPSPSATATPTPCTGGAANARWTVGNGHCYQRFDTPRNWSAARNDCAARAGYLATLTSQGEQDFVWSSVGIVHSWIGFTDEASTGTWLWVTGEPSSYTNWGLNQPDNVGFEHYGEFGDNSGFWNNLTSVAEPYICEAP